MQIIGFGGQKCGVHDHRALPPSFNKWWLRARGKQVVNFYESSDYSGFFFKMQESLC